MISEETKEQIIAACKVEEVVGDFVNLKKRGVNLLGLCPFHNEKTPSFNVSPTKNIYKCFGCGEGGDSITFIMKHEQMSFVESLKYLADKYGIIIEEKALSPEDGAKKNKKDALFILMNNVSKHLHKNLMETDEGKHQILTYLFERNIKIPIINKFQLGWSLKSSEDLLTWAKKNEYPNELLEETGMMIRNDQGEYIARFRERIMFPIVNLSGKTIAFGGRIIRKDANVAKYINSPDTELYNKSEVLYGLYQAREKIRKIEEAILCEGYMDVLAMHQAGFDNAIASSGTSFTAGQAGLLKRYSHNLTILYDGDNAGQAATLRAIELALTEDLNVRVITLPAEHDPDSFTNAYDAEYIQNYLTENKKDWLKWSVDKVSTNDINDPVTKSNLIKEWIKLILLVKDSIKRSMYIKSLAAYVKVNEELLHQELRLQYEIVAKKAKTHTEAFNESLDQMVINENGEYEKVSPTLHLLNDILEQEKQILKVLIRYGHLPTPDSEMVIELILKRLDDMSWEHITHQQLYEVVKERKSELYALEFNISADLVPEALELKELAATLLNERYELSPNWRKILKREIITPDSDYMDVINSSITYLFIRKYMKMVQFLNDEINIENHQDLDINRLQENLVMIQHLQNERNTLAKSIGAVVLK
ncbi:MAG: DNA primase [Bacteroidota bacterium]|nr:DNA primase [Bacteroidota bacterium]